MKDNKNYKRISILSHMYKQFTWILKTRMERFLMKTNQQKRLISEKKVSPTVDHLQATTELIAK